MKNAHLNENKDQVAKSLNLKRSALTLLNDQMPVVSYELDLILSRTIYSKEYKSIMSLKRQHQGPTGD